MIRWPAPLRRLLGALVTVLAVSALAFAILGGPPARQGGAAAGNGDAPSLAAQAADAVSSLPPVRYVLWLGRALVGDLGPSAGYRQPVLGLVARSLPPTIELVALAIAAGAALGLGGGLLLFAARGAMPAADAVQSLVLTGVAVVASVPALVWAVLLLLAGSLLGVPVAGRLSPELAWPGGSGFLLADAILAGDAAALGSALAHLALPVIALGLPFALAVAVALYRALLEQAGRDHILTLRLRGQTDASLAWRNLIAAAPAAAARLGHDGMALVAMTPIVEVVFTLPGLGALLVQAVATGDRALILGSVLGYGCLLSLVWLCRPRPRPDRVGTRRP